MDGTAHGGACRAIPFSVPFFLPFFLFITFLSLSFQSEKNLIHPDGPKKKKREEKVRLSDCAAIRLTFLPFLSPFSESRVPSRRNIRQYSQQDLYDAAGECDSAAAPPPLLFLLAGPLLSLQCLALTWLDAGSRTEG